MRYFVLILMFILSNVTFSHEKEISRADFFINELRVSETLMKKIEGIDKKYRIIYQKLNAEIQFRNSELNEIIQTKPFNEEMAKSILSKISEAQSLIKLNNIKHHIEIESYLDSFQRMKYNDFFSP